MKKLIVIKLGGSVVTYKDSPTPKVRISTIKRLAKEIKQIHKLGYKIILVHGAGSFAHGLVKKHDLHHGMKTKEQKQAFKLVQKKILQLNRIIKDCLKDVRLDVITFPPHTFITQTEGKLNDFDLNLIKKSLSLNQIPILFGDMVLDDQWGCSVLSGDTIICYLGNKLKADKVIFLSDVDGIYDQDPRKNPKAKIIREITNKNLSKVLKYLSETGRDDVTGEMKGKILQIKNSLKQVPVILLNGLKKQLMVQAASSNLAPIGTRLYLD